MGLFLRGHVSAWLRRPLLAFRRPQNEFELKVPLFSWSAVLSKSLWLGILDATEHHLLKLGGQTEELECALFELAYSNNAVVRFCHNIDFLGDNVESRSVVPLGRVPHGFAFAVFFE